MASGCKFFGGVILAAVLAAAAPGHGAALDSTDSAAPRPFTLSLLPWQGSEQGAVDSAPPLHIISEGVVGAIDRPNRPLLMAVNPDESPSREPLMGLLDKARLATYLDDARINIYGHIEGSYSILYTRRKPPFITEPPEGFDQDREADSGITGRLFDFRQADKALLNRVDINIERLVHLTPHDWDFGFRTEFMYGSDARYIHANGWDYSANERPHELQSRADAPPRSPFDGPEYQWDLTQAYLDIGIPLGNGMRFRAGKFLFFLNLDPNQSIFYSHSIWWTASLPYTLTGGTLEYAFTKDLDAEVGVSRGWNQSLLDNNSSPDYFFRITKDISDRMSVTFAGITGPEFQKSMTNQLTHVTYRFPDRSHYLTAMELNFSYKLTDRLSLYVDGVFGHKARTPQLANGALNFVVIENSQQAAANWYGVTGQLQYEIDPHLYLGGRLEFYRDEEGFTIGNSAANSSDREGTGQTNYYEGTIGVTILPFPTDPIGKNLKIRPEVRFDYATNPNVFNGHDFQSTFAVDAIYNF